MWDAAVSTKASTICIIAGLGLSHPRNIFREEAFAIVKRQHFHSFEWKIGCGLPSLHGDSIHVVKLRVVEEGHNVFISFWNLFPLGSVLGCHSNEKALVSHREVVPGRTGQVEVVRK